MKLEATINPNNAGYQSPIFFMDGENTAGRLNTIHIKPSTQTTDNNIGRFRVTTSILRIKNIYEFTNDL